MKRWKENKVKIFVLTIVILFGLYVPFDHKIHLIIIFYLFIPLSFIFLICLIYFIYSLFDKKLKHGVFALTIIPLFVLSTMTSTFGTEFIQKTRCQKHISKIEEIKNQEGFYPKDYHTTFGIEYNYSKNNKFTNTECYSLEFERGFFIKEVYNSYNKEWKSYGWND